MVKSRLILHPTDFSESSNNAFILACSLAREKNAKLVILHVMLPSGAPLLDDPSSGIESSASSQETVERSFPWPKPSKREIVTEHRVAEGDASTEILRFAESEKCDMIVIGSHGRTGFRRLITGSVAEDVLRKASCPVLIVKDLPKDGVVEPAKPLAMPGQVINALTSGDPSEADSEQSLVKGHDLEIVRRIISAGQTIEQQKSVGEIVINCLKGHVELMIVDKTQILAAGQVICLPGNEVYSIKGIDDALLIMTKQVPKS